jgi:hypothetical protein
MRERERERDLLCTMEWSSLPWAHCVGGVKEGDR